MKLLKQIVGWLMLMGTGALLLVVVMKGSNLTFDPTDKVSGSDFVSIILSALGVMLTAVTVFLGALALIGWSSFENRVQESAKAFMVERFSDEDPDHQDFLKKLEVTVCENANTFIEKTFSEDNPRYLQLVEDLKKASIQ